MAFGTSRLHLCSSVQLGVPVRPETQPGCPCPSVTSSPSRWPVCPASHQSRLGPCRHPHKARSSSRVGTMSYPPCLPHLPHNICLPAALLKARGHLGKVPVFSSASQSPDPISHPRGYRHPAGPFCVPPCTWLVHTPLPLHRLFPPPRKPFLLRGFPKHARGDNWGWLTKAPLNNRR